jgi:hypothetical protein
MGRAPVGQTASRRQSNRLTRAGSGALAASRIGGDIARSSGDQDSGSDDADDGAQGGADPARATPAGLEPSILLAICSQLNRNGLVAASQVCTLQNWCLVFDFFSGRKSTTKGAGSYCASCGCASVLAVVLTPFAAFVRCTAYRADPPFCDLSDAVCDCICICVCGCNTSWWLGEPIYMLCCMSAQLGNVDAGTHWRRTIDSCDELWSAAAVR